MSTAPNLRVLAGRYEVGEVIGEGGMGRVHASHDTMLQREVAVKVLRPGIGQDPESRARFRHEALVAARINHPHVVAVFDVGIDGDDLFLVMELLSGRTLADEIASGPLAPEAGRALAVDLLQGLGAAHDAGVLHRDVKPANVLLTDAGSSKLGDFGIAKLHDDVGLTQTGLLVGTASYLPPERLAGQPATKAGDQYSLALVLYEALTGVAPFRGDSALAVAHAIANTEAVPLHQLRPDIAPELAAAVERGMAKDPAARFPDVRAMADAAAGPDPDVGAATQVFRLPVTAATSHHAPTAVLATAHVTPPVGVGLVEPTATTTGRGRRPIGTILAVAALVVVGIGAAWFAGQDDAAPVGTPAIADAVSTTSTAAPTTTASVSTTTTMPTNTTTVPAKTTNPPGADDGKKGKGKDND